MTVQLRRPALEVLIDGVNGQPKALSAQCAFGYDQRTSTAVIRLRELPSGTLKKLQTRIILSMTADSQFDPPTPRFWGYLVEIDPTLYPRSIDLICRGPLVRAEVYECTASGGLDLARFNGTSYDGDTDENMVRNVLQEVGLTTFDYTSSMGAPPKGDPTFPVAIGDADPLGGTTHPTGTPDSGTGQTLGVTNGAQFVWAEGQNAMAYIEGLDAICLGYRTYEAQAGAIVRNKIQPFAGTSSPWPAFTEGVDILSASGQQTIVGAKNRVNVTGYNPGGPGAVPANFSLQQANPLLSGFVTDQISSSLIERAMESDPGTGLSCEAVGRWDITQVNRELYKYTLTTTRDDGITPNSTIEIRPSTDPLQPARLGLDGFYYVQNAQTAVDTHGAFTVTLIVLGGPGSMAAINVPPGVDFIMHFEKELIVVAGVETPLYTLHCTPAVSAANAAIASYAWSTAGGANRAPTSGTGDTFTTTSTSLTGWTITLLVTDAASLTGGVTKQAPPDVSGTYLVRKLYLAGTDTIDDYNAATTWHVHAQTAAIVVANAPLWADGVHALASLDDLATAPTSSTPFSSGNVTALWCETNISASALLAGSSAGHIAYSNGGAWVDTGAVPDGNPILKCLISGAIASQWFALTAVHLYRTDNSGSGWVIVQAAAGGETFRDWSLSFARGMICMSGGRLMIDLAGTTQTFPAGPSDIVAVTADIRADRFYCYDASGNTFAHVNGGDTALVAKTALNLGGGAAQPRGLWRDGNARGLLYYAAGSGGAWKTLDGFGSSGGYKQVRKPGVGSSPGGAVYTQIGADGLLFASPSTPPSTQVLISAAGQGVVLAPVSLPAGWYTLGYDDSAWTASLAMTTDISAFYLPPPGGAWISVSATQFPAGGQWLLRHHFTLAAGVITRATMQINYDDYLVGFWVNGIFMFADMVHNEPQPSAALTVDIPSGLLLPGQSNLLACYIQNAGTSGHGTSPSAVSYRIVIS